MRRGGVACLALSLLAGVAFAQAELPPIESLPPLEATKDSTTETEANKTAEATEKAETDKSLRDISAWKKPDFGIAAPAEAPDLPPLPPLPGTPPAMAETAEKIATKTVSLPTDPPTLQELPPIELPAMDTAAATEASGELPPAPPSSELAPPAPIPPAAEAQTPPPLPPETATETPAETAAKAPLAVPELPDLPDFTSITDPQPQPETPAATADADPVLPDLPPPPPGMDIASETTTPAPPPAETPVTAPPAAEAPATEAATTEEPEALPTIADLLGEDAPVSPETSDPAQENTETPAEIEAANAEATTAETADSDKEIVWPRDFKTQILPAQIYRKQYAATNVHLPHALYYQEMEAHLFYAVGTNNLRGIRALMNAGVPLSIRSNIGETLLSHAMRHHAFDAGRLLLALGVNPNEANPDGSTPLHYATQTGNAGMVQALLYAGADPRAMDMNGVTPLVIAGGNPALAQLMGYSRFSDAHAAPAGYSTYMK